MKDLRVLVLSLSLAVVLTACSYPEDNFTGSEYMPDMGHSLAVEANTYNYYYYNTWDKESTIELAKLVYPRTVPAGTVPRGYASAYTPGEAAPKTLKEINALRGSMVDADQLNAISVPTNGQVPYYYDATPEGRLAAIAELIDNPFPITEDGLARGKHLYDIYCGICHGEKGNGLGYLYNDEENKNAKYPLAPANFLNAEFLAASNGRYYNAIMHGYNAMGAYKDKLSFEERWQVIHYIRNLQAKETKMEYSPLANTLNTAFGMPAAEFEAMAGQGHGDEPHMQAADHGAEMHQAAGNDDAGHSKK